LLDIVVSLPSSYMTVLNGFAFLVFPYIDSDMLTFYDTLTFLNTEDLTSKLYRLNLIFAGNQFENW